MASEVKGMTLAHLFLTQKIFILSEVGISRRLYVRVGVGIIFGFDVFLTAVFLIRVDVSSSDTVSVIT